MTYVSDGCSPAELRLLEIDERDTPRILEAHRLLTEVMGIGAVEDVSSFLGTVSSSTDDKVVPRLVCAVHRERLHGVVVGAYLKDLNMGMILYSAVREAFRGRGLYSGLRGRLIALLNKAAGCYDGRTGGSRRGCRKIDYLISEVELTGWLAQTYVRRWGAFVAACDYEQPAVQGLKPRKLALVLQPIAKRVRPTSAEIASIVREIYERVYRVPEVLRNAEFRRVIESVHAPASFSLQELR